MIRTLLIGVTAFAWAGAAFGQSLDEYLKLRKQHGIEKPTTIEHLGRFVGSKVIEVRGVVKGAVQTEDGALLMLHSEKGDLPIDADTIPSWLTGNEVPARILVQIERSMAGASLRARFLGAAADGQVAAFEKKILASAKPASRAVRPSPVVSRASGRPAPLKGNIGSSRNWELPASDALPYYAAYVKKQNKRLSDDEATRIAQGVIGFSIEYGVDARLIMAMVLVESGFDPTCTSRAGAMGLGQLMPGTARGMGVSKPYDSIDNLYGTVRLVRGHLDKYTKQTGGDPYRSLVLTLAAYNAGGGAVRKHGGVPPYRETQNYVKKVIAAYQRLIGEA
jgi:soluble lytic murein transglycosylase-like protein